MPQVPVRLTALLPLLVLTACGSPDQSATTTVEGTGAAEVATDWTVENPTDRAVPVTQPSTQMTNERVEATGPAK